MLVRYSDSYRNIRISEFYRKCPPLLLALIIAGPEKEVSCRVISWPLPQCWPGRRCGCAVLEVDMRGTGRQRQLALKCIAAEVVVVEMDTWQRQRSGKLLLWLAGTGRAAALLAGASSGGWMAGPWWRMILLLWGKRCRYSWKRSGKEATVVTALTGTDTEAAVEGGSRVAAWVSSKGVSSALSARRQGSPHGPGKAAQIDGIDVDDCVCGEEGHDVWIKGERMAVTKEDSI